jgi:hypothetical protein
MRGERIAVVTVPIGPPACVQTDAGALIRGYRVPEDHVPETRHHGRCVRFRRVTKDDAIVIDADGVHAKHASQNGWSFAELSVHDRTEIRDAEPPPLLERIQPIASEAPKTFEEVCAVLARPVRAHGTRTPSVSKRAA